MFFTLHRPRRVERSLCAPCQPRIEHLEDRAVPTNLPPGFTESLFSSGIEHAACMVPTPDGRLFVCEQYGNLRVVQPSGFLEPEPFLHVDVNTDGEHGLDGMVLDPHFEENGYVYIYYTVAADPTFARVSRFTASAANPNVAEPGSEMVVIELGALSSIYHIAGDMEFGVDGKLYISVGDDGSAENAQLPSNLFGKMLRINSDGSIPSDNPWADNPAVRGEIYAFGLRNPYRFAVQPRTGLTYINEVSSEEPEAREEVNKLYYGANYGWPEYIGYSNDPDYTDPIYAYEHGPDPETGGYNCAVTGAVFYTPGERSFPRTYYGDYLFADLCGNWIRRYDPVTGEMEVFASDTKPLTVEIVEDVKGSLYYLGYDGYIYRIKYSPPAPLPSVTDFVSPVARPHRHSARGTINLAAPLTEDETPSPIQTATSEMNSASTRVRLLKRVSDDGLAQLDLIANLRDLIGA